MKLALYILTGCLMTNSLMLSSCQNNQSNGRIASDRSGSRSGADVKNDSQLVIDLAASNYAEVSMANTAIEKSENKEVKDMAAQLREDHAALVSQLKAYADKKHIRIPQSEPDKAAKNTKKLAEKTKSEDFDKLWCVELLRKHDQTISRMEEAAKDATDPDLRAWVNQALPTVRAHREHLKDCNDSLR